MTILTIGNAPFAYDRVSQTRRAFLASSFGGMGTLCALGCSTFSRLTTKTPVADASKIDDGTSQVKSELERYASANPTKKPLVCFVGVSGAGAESISTVVREQLEDDEKYRVLPKNEMQDALKKSGVRDNNLFIPAEQKKFVKELAEPVDYILVGYVEKVQVDESNEDKGKKDVLRLELVEVGKPQKASFVVDL